MSYSKSLKSRIKNYLDDTNQTKKLDKINSQKKKDEYSVVMKDGYNFEVDKESTHKQDNLTPNTQTDVSKFQSETENRTSFAGNLESNFNSACEVLKKLENNKEAMLFEKQKYNDEMIKLEKTQHSLHAKIDGLEQDQEIKLREFSEKINTIKLIKTDNSDQDIRQKHKQRIENQKEVQEKLKQEKVKLTNKFVNIEKIAEQQSNQDLDQYHNEINPLNEKKQKIELDINNANENYNSLIEHSHELIKKIQKQKELVHSRNSQHEILLKGRAELDSICSEFKTKQCEELNYYLEEKQLLDSLADLDAQRTTVVKQITTTIDEIDDLNLRLADIKRDIDLDKSKVKELSHDMVVSSQDNRIEMLESEINNKIIKNIKNSTKLATQYSRPSLGESSQHKQMGMTDVSQFFDSAMQTFDIQIENLICMTQFHQLKEEEFFTTEEGSQGYSEVATVKMKLDDLRLIKDKLVERSIEHERQFDVAKQDDQVANKLKFLSDFDQREEFISQVVNLCNEQFECDHHYIYQLFGSYFDALLSRESQHQALSLQKDELLKMNEERTAERVEIESHIQKLSSVLEELKSNQNYLKEQNEQFRNNIDEKMQTLSYVISEKAEQEQRLYLQENQDQFNGLDKIQGKVLANKMNKELKEEFQSQFVKNWKVRKDNIQQVYNKIEEKEAELESANEQKRVALLELENLQNKVSRFEREKESIINIIKEREDELLLVSMQLDKMESEKRRLIKETLTSILKQRNCEYILDEIQRTDDELQNKRIHIKNLEEQFENLQVDHIHQSQERGKEARKAENEVMLAKADAEADIRNIKIEINKNQLSKTSQEKHLCRIEAQLAEIELEINKARDNVRIAQEAQVYGQEIEQSGKKLNRKNINEYFTKKNNTTISQSLADINKKPNVEIRYSPQSFLNSIMIDNNKENQFVKTKNTNSKNNNDKSNQDNIRRPLNFDSDKRSDELEKSSLNVHHVNDSGDTGYKIKIRDTLIKSVVKEINNDESILTDASQLIKINYKKFIEGCEVYKFSDTGKSLGHDFDPLELVEPEKRGFSKKMLAINTFNDTLEITNKNKRIKDTVINIKDIIKTNVNQQVKLIVKTQKRKLNSDKIIFNSKIDTHTIQPLSFKNKSKLNLKDLHNKGLLDVNDQNFIQRVAHNKQWPIKIITKDKCLDLIFNNQNEFNSFSDFIHTLTNKFSSKNHL